jgi:hypothetical protein
VIAVPKWEKRNLRLSQDHGWKSKRGYQILVIDRGAVRFDFPQDWVMTMETNESSGLTTVKLTDRPEPDDDCRLQVTHMYLPPGIDWSKLPLTEMLEHAMSGPDENEVLGKSLIVHEQRRYLELAWIETRFVEPNENREARSRTSLARRDDVQVLFTLDYWPEDATRVLPVFDEAMRSLRLGEYIEDPTRGPGS